MVWSNPITIPEKADFLALFDNLIPYIEIPDFINANQTASLVSEIHNIGLQYYEYAGMPSVVPKARHIFQTHYEFEEKTPNEYFMIAQSNIDRYLTFCAKSGVNLAEMVRLYLSEKFQQPVNYATQAGDAYTYAMVRELKSSAMLHADFAQFLDQRWSISNVVKEYAWNVYLTDPGEGGECVIYEKPWEREDDIYLIEGTYGYFDDVVRGTTSRAIKIKIGSLVFFNCRNFHRVNASGDMRLSIGGHVGLTKDNEIIMWV